MSKFIIQGKNSLSGEIKVSGAKNAALKLIPATILTDRECILKNIPDIADVNVMMEILKDLGAKVYKNGNNEYSICCRDINKIDLNPQLACKLRASIMFIAPMLARLGEVKFPHPGGCIIGRRPIDIFLNGFKAQGAEIKEESNFFHLKTKGLSGCNFVFPWISHTVTESMILTATLASGITTLINTACEPEVVALSKFLNKCGAKIKGAGTSTILIEGVDKVSGGIFNNIPDRIETGTFAVLGALIGDDIKIINCQPKHLEVFWLMLKKAGVEFKIGEDFVHIKRCKNILPTEARTHEYPGFVTDLQAPFTILMTQAEGMSLIYETIYEGRLFYTDILNRMGANIIMCDPHRIVVNGPTPLFGNKVESPDLRAGIALILAALIAEGESEIDNIYQIDRGYEDIEKRLVKLGARIKRV